MRLMPCMYLTHCELGRLGSGLRRYKYSATCLSTPIKKLYTKDTVYQKKGSLKLIRELAFCGRFRLF
jgi:hypothetical protein